MEESISSPLLSGIERITSLIAVVGFMKNTISSALQLIKVDRACWAFRIFWSICSSRKAMGWNGKINVESITNNYGYVTPIPFNKHDKVNCIIGDSNVEGSLVEFSHSFHGILYNKGYNIYPIAISGSSLSDYLIFTEFALNNFNCQKIILVIMDNDFDESMQRRPAHHYFDEFDEGKLKLISYKPSKVKILLRKFAIPNYIIKNLKARVVISQLFNKNYNKGIVDINQSKTAIDIFFQHLSKISFKTENILFVLDGDRRSIYNNKLNEKSEISEAFNYFKTKSANYKIKFLDLDPIFQLYYSTNNKIFSFGHDFHWNEYGHSIVADEIIKSEFLFFN